MNPRLGDDLFRDTTGMTTLESHLLGGFHSQSNLNQPDHSASKSTWKRFGTHHVSASTFLASVARRCVVCESIRAAVSKLSDDFLATGRLFNSFTTYGVYYFPAWGTCWLVFHLGLSEEGMELNTDHSILEFLCRPPEYFSAHIEVNSLVPAHTEGSDSTENLDVAMAWIQICDETHDCLRQQSDGSGFSPTRLLDVGSTEDSVVKLVTSPPAHERYVTLSYCWGTGTSVRLLSHKIEGFQRGIHVESLPRTLQEAFRVSRGLGIKYIWIDALCIVQDSESDWNHESSKMAEIYRNSYCNIAATSSKDCHGGLIKARSPDHLGTILVTTGWEGCENGSLGLIDRFILRHNIEKAPLNARGWVLQERHLSPRTLHFADTRLFWECYKTTACETWPAGVARGCQLALLKRNLGHPAPRDALYLYWRQLLRSYTATRLTMEEDKLPAISGLARKLAALLSDKYVVGLWGASLLTELLWHAATRPGHRPSSYLGPTWSWVSTNGQVDTNIHWTSIDTVHTALARVVNYQIEYATDDVFGRVRSATLRLSGRIYPATFLHPMQPSADKPLYGSITFDDCQINAHCLATSYTLDVALGSVGSVHTYCLPLLVDIEGVRLIRGLLLQPTGNNRGEYSRIGTFTCFPNSSEAGTAVFNEEQYHLDPTLVDEEDHIVLI
ncbi:heterokaryon incompatibility protein-domain-containing protein [Podospora aff. communis PSN243]|uniref:Heterokaryon incompatibility protein-domain-containing protein n=1 Tax=Podospora aff. communis PSN243 TaxID=3040156 RepID=A0AAV9GSP0_9PEZI|nr:heterokaryon incompatibility protein-domain-containing protein [Podospora aff. communis PSN243]